MPLDPATITTTASRPVSPLPSPHPHSHPHHHYLSPQQQQQTLPIRAPNPQLAKPHDPSQQHFVYPFSSGTFAPKGVRGLAAPDHGVAAGYPPPSLMYSHGGVRGMHLDYLSHGLHVTRPLPHVPFPHLGNATPTAASPPVKKAAPRSAVSDINGYKETSTRERNKEDTYVVVRDRKQTFGGHEPSTSSLQSICFFLSILLSRYHVEIQHFSLPSIHRPSRLCDTWRLMIH
ncbi:hypothetical protein VNO77_27432 [Canavalia gladiata]|uniref:Uncharacterized protein n=1 Tax=Canavalia gladiata TaxID=3824 RepID=A0AAN9Q459_CANGL